jgi:hypothetical protein
MEMERSRFASYRRIVARGRHITLTQEAYRAVEVFSPWIIAHVITLSGRITSHSTIQKMSTASL